MTKNKFIIIFKNKFSRVYHCIIVLIIFVLTIIKYDDIITFNFQHY